MNNIFAWISLLTGLYMIMIAFMVKTQNIRSAFLFKFTPFILGCGSIGVALKLFDIISLKM